MSAGLSSRRRAAPYPEAIERVGAVAVDHHVGSGDESLEGGAPARLAQIEGRAPLAGGHLRKERGDLFEARRVDAQHLGPVGREQASAHGSGHHPREVEDPDAGEGRATLAGPGKGDRADRVVKANSGSRLTATPCG